MEENTTQTNETSNVDELLQLFGFTNEDLSLLNNEETIETSSSENIVETQEINIVKEESILKEIPENSKTLLIKENTSRFSGAIWANKIKSLNVILAGVGGIGSWVGLLLSRLDINNLILFDDDIVDTTNLSGQLYSMKDISSKKVYALSNKLVDFSDFYKTSTYANKYIHSSIIQNIMICGFDNMEARKIFFQRWKSQISDSIEKNKNLLFIDGRLAAEELQVFCLRGDDKYSIDKYEKEYLFSDAEAEETICSYKQTSFMSNMIASVIVNLLVNHASNLCKESILDRDLPFYTQYNAETMYFKTIA